MQACLPGVDCTIQSQSDTFSFDVDNGFNTATIPPNWGDFSPESLLDLCTCLNSGMCSFQCTSIPALGYWTAEGQVRTGTRTFPPVGGITPEEWIALLLASLASIIAWLNLIRSLPIERVRPRDDADECHDVGRRWRRTVSIPEGVTPGSIISTISMGLGVGMPPFHAGQDSVNKRDVECIASGMQQGYARAGWYHFTFGRYTGGMRTAYPARLGYDPNDYLGQWVLVDGHHRFLALLISGVAPMTPSTNMLGIAPNVYPWWAVSWGL